MHIFHKWRLVKIVNSKSGNYEAAYCYICDKCGKKKYKVTCHILAESMQEVINWYNEGKDAL